VFFSKGTELQSGGGLSIALTSIPNTHSGNVRPKGIVYNNACTRTGIHQPAPVLVRGRIRSPQSGRLRLVKLLVLAT
jgi:hypothetical protein